ncbi:Velvet domain-containing protein [Mycena kentingensis (nom. inval.)]|nr:Velvet domain-containing protein [Mycena kentingensis (nom. inval.)]
MPAPALKYDVTIRQQPLHARISAMKISDRRPVDPPIIVQLHVTSADLQAQGRSAAAATNVAPRTTLTRSPSNMHPHLTNPYYFMYAALVTPQNETEVKCDGGKPSTSGALVSSVRVLKDHPNSDDDAAFFIFPDICVRLEGSWRFKLTLFVIDSDRVKNSTRACKAISTPLTRALAAQGVKLRIRKEVRASDKAPSSSATPSTAPAIPLSLPSGQGMKTEHTETPSPLHTLSRDSVMLPRLGLWQPQGSAQAQAQAQMDELDRARFFVDVERSGDVDVDLGRSPPKRRRTLTALTGPSSSYSASMPGSPTEIRMEGTGAGRMGVPHTPLQLPQPMSFDVGLGMVHQPPQYQQHNTSLNSQAHFRRSSYGGISLSGGNVSFGSLPAPPPPRPQWITQSQPQPPASRLPPPGPSFDFLPSPYVGGGGKGSSDEEFELHDDDEFSLSPESLADKDASGSWQEHLLRPSHPSPKSAYAGGGGEHRRTGSEGSIYAAMPVSVFPAGSPVHSGSGNSEDDLEFDLDPTGSGGGGGGVGTPSGSSGYESYSSSSPVRDALPTLPSLGNFTMTMPLPGNSFWPAGSSGTYTRPDNASAYPRSVAGSASTTGVWPGVSRPTAGPIFGGHAY